VQINEAVASRMIKVGLELGGKDATYVCEDANVKVRRRPRAVAHTTTANRQRGLYACRVSCVSCVSCRVV
jgi:acyl-CoA reductase-like NAD-dependent aldehyde dehydrogenase